MVSMNKKKEVRKYSIVDKLNEADEQLRGDPSLLGMCMLTWPQYINAMRGNMNTSHLKQFVNMIEPNFPYLFTGLENIVGKHSSGYKKLKGDKVVYKKIEKFKDILDKPMQYYLFLYDKKKDEYSVVHRGPCESLTENFGYEYKNEVIDSLNEKDEIPDGTILYRSTSYDEDMNYCYGKNVTVALTLNSYTSEDAAVASRSLCEHMVSIEANDVTIGLNNNDFLINLYGDKDHYKGLPDVGEYASHRLCAVRRQFNNQLLSDFKEESLSQIRDGDFVYFVDKDCQIIDYEIYSNNEEEVSNTFTKQILKYLHSQNKFYEKILKTTEKIMKSGSKFTKDVEYLFKRAGEFLDNQKKWREGYSEFSNYKVIAYFKRNAHLAKGSKVVGKQTC